MKLGHLCLCFYLIVVGVLSVTNAGILLLLDK
jgi:hypothetical protein